MTKRELIDGLIANGFDVTNVAEACVDWLASEIADASFGRLTFGYVESVLTSSGDEVLAAAKEETETVAEFLEKFPRLAAELGFEIG